MVKVMVVSREEAQNTRKTKAPGARRQRMNEFDTYALELIDHAEEAVLYQDLGENPQKFVLSLRGAFKRAKFPATVRKMRGRDEVRAWRGEQPRPAAAKARGRRAAK
jgi:hypothetical protein